jgi:hypothetical protein
MIKKATTAVLALAALAFALPASGAVLLDEQFSYGDGDIAVVSGGLWSNHSGANNPVVVSQELLVDGINESGDVNRALSAAQSDQATTYACLKVRVDGTTVSGSGEYFAHFRSSVNTFNFRSRVFATSAGATFTFGIASTSSGTTPTVPWGVALNFGQVYTVVHSYNAATGESKLWVDPVTEASASVSSSAAVAAGEAIDQYAFRQAGSPVQEYCDDLKVGQTFADVCGGATPTTATSWGRVKALYR